MSDDWSAPTLHRATDVASADDPADAGPDALEPVDVGYAALAGGLGPAVPDPTGAAPATAVADLAGWSAAVLHDADGPAAAAPVPPDSAWGAVTYAGSRRRRPGGDRAAATGRAWTAGRGDDEFGDEDPRYDDPRHDDPPDDLAGVVPGFGPPQGGPVAAGGPDEAVVAGTDLVPYLPVDDGEPAGEAAPAPARTGGLLAAGRTMAVASLVSRVTGLLRTVAIAAVLGSAVGNIQDPYNTANALPNMVYELLVGGVLSSVLIPLIVYAQEHDPDRGDAYTQRLLSIATAVLGAATMLAVLAAPWITAVVVGDADKRPLTSIFATLLLPEIFFYGVGALLVAVLNSRGVFGPGAWAPVLNNLVVLVTVAVFFVLPGGTPTIGSITDTQILVLGLGTTLGIVVQAVVLLPALRRCGFTWNWRFRPTHAGENERLREVRTLALWVLGYVAASQVGVVVIQRVGTTQGDTGYSTFAYADLLFQVPYGIIGVSLLTALMPRMSRAAANGDLDAVVDDLGLGARLSAVSLVPVSVGLMVLGPSLTTTILLGRFSADSASLVGVVLAMSAFGLLPFAVVMLQLRVFYAMRDARVPTLVNIAMVGSKVVVVLLAVLVFDSPVRVIEALGVATSLSYVVGAVVGHVLLGRRLRALGHPGTLGFRAVGVTVLRVAVASVAGAAVALLVVLAARAVIDDPRGAAVAGLVLGAGLGLAVTVAVAWALKIPEVRDVAAVVTRRNTGTPAAVTAGQDPDTAPPADPPRSEHP